MANLRKAICEVDQRLLLPFVAWHLCREGVNNFPGILGSPPQLPRLCSSQNLRTQCLCYSCLELADSPEDRQGDLQVFTGKADNKICGACYSYASELNMPILVF